MLAAMFSCLLTVEVCHRDHDVGRDLNHHLGEMRNQGVHQSFARDCLDTSNVDKSYENYLRIRPASGK